MPDACLTDPLPFSSLAERLWAIFGFFPFWSLFNHRCGLNTRFARMRRSRSRSSSNLRFSCCSSVKNARLHRERNDSHTHIDTNQRTIVTSLLQLKRVKVSEHILLLLPSIARTFLRANGAHTCAGNRLTAKQNRDTHRIHE